MSLSVAPEDWFLKDRGNPDSKLSIYTKGNKVEPLIDGSAYMERLHDFLISAGEGDFFYYVGWELNLELRLILGADDSKVLKLFTDARANKVDIRVMLSDHPFSHNNKADKAFRAPPAPIEPAQCILDARLRPLGSAHQKFSTFFTDRAHGPMAQPLPAKKLHAFCGGIDLQFDRWDRGTHDFAQDKPNPKAETQSRQFTDFNGGWHDVTTYIEGPACVDLYLTFLERWNNPQPSRPFERGAFTKIEPQDLTTVSPEVGDQFVQVLRTYSCGYFENHLDPNSQEIQQVNVPYPFASKGESSVRDACLHAISMAQYYIYIEDQYFFSFEIADALKQAIKNRPNLRVIVLVAHEPTGDGQGTRFENNYHFNAVEHLKEEQAGGRFAIYDLFSTCKPDEQIYVHAKLMIVDDIWVEIGSMNCNRRSTTHDMEAAVAVVDGKTVEVTFGDPQVTYTVCKFAQDLRLKLWAEHLGTTPEDPAIRDPVKGFDEWAQRTLPDSLGRHSTQARPHMRGIRKKASKFIWDNLVDPQGTCPGSPIIPRP